MKLKVVTWEIETARGKTEVGWLILIEACLYLNWMRICFFLLIKALEDGVHRVVAIYACEYACVLVIDR